MKKLLTKLGISGGIVLTGLVVSTPLLEQRYINYASKNLTYQRAQKWGAELIMENPDISLEEQGKILNIISESAKKEELTQELIKDLKQKTPWLNPLYSHIDKKYSLKR